jgi:hypothetical protein
VIAGEHWHGIPGKFVTDPTAPDGRRFIATHYGEKLLLERMRENACSACELCLQPTHYGQRHHIYGRGFGSGKREDRWEVEGIVFVIYICGSCHRKQDIERWGSWNDTTATIDPVAS